MIKGNRGGRRVKGKTYKLYHGSPNADIEQFDVERAGANTNSGERLIYFTDSKEFADEFSYERLATNSKFFNEKGKKGKVYKVDVTMKKPLDLTNPTEKDIKNMIKMSDGELDSADIMRFSKGNNQLLKTYIDVNKIAEYGYDGFIAKVGRGSKALEYGVLSGKQAKIRK